MMRLIVAESGLSSADVRSGKLTAEQWRHLEQTTRILPTAPLFIDDTPALSIYELRSKARRLKAQHDIQIIIIDYLQLMTGNADSRGNREQEVASISRGLKSIARSSNIPIIALSQAQPLHRVALRPQAAAGSPTCANRGPSSRMPTSWPSSTVRNTSASHRTKTATRRRVWPKSSSPSTVTARRIP